MNVLKKIKLLACAGNRFPNFSPYSFFYLRHPGSCAVGEAYEKARWNFTSRTETCLMIWIWDNRWRFLQESCVLDIDLHVFTVARLFILHSSFNPNPLSSCGMRSVQGCAVLPYCKMGLLFFHFSLLFFYARLWRACAVALIQTMPAATRGPSPSSPPPKKWGGVDIWPFIVTSAKCIRVDPRTIAFLAKCGFKNWLVWLEVVKKGPLSV